MHGARGGARFVAARRRWTLLTLPDDRNDNQDKGWTSRPAPHFHQLWRTAEIGRASCRGKSVDLGGRRILKKKKKRKTATGPRSVGHAAPRTPVHVHRARR